ncbi:alkyl hydroperoxide reductase/ Thiol specific antioxidant/ Mal allergen [Hymenobacter roseosalivarius DSM 11622]|uniref:thioredoxin-dependent peroxiredoxin n=1 Tax=Hymenobacter roseosalivarius DSM 11622 TaxID=645990 RepID=A0A1W1W1J0_9BACT|nr:peroxiredoxin-like family protein [Hymenobacter roseosalivarius]SMB99468.1 alkyl hydroperoxide reductase/ Thiol specific antioxidant/ Mal allergen [Hymenobacter roseosalivarius DSM 11622]
MNNCLLLSFATLALALPQASHAQQTSARTAAPLAAGSVAPAFKGKDAAGRPVELKQLLKKGPVVLYFYRGQWCPYCNKQLSQLQDSLQLLTAKGAQVVVITPETQENIGKTVEKTKAAFPIVQDRGFVIMTAYHTTFTVDEPTAKKYRGFGVDLRQANGAQEDVLPVPATYVIGCNGRIKFVYFNPDYKQRASVHRIAAAL